MPQTGDVCDDKPSEENPSGRTQDEADHRRTGTMSSGRVTEGFTLVLRALPCCEPSKQRRGLGGTGGGVLEVGHGFVERWHKAEAKRSRLHHA